MNTFRRIFSYANPAAKYWPPYLFFSILSVLFGIVNYALLAPVLTVLFEADEVPLGLPKPEFELSIGYFEDIFSYYLSHVISLAGGSLMAGLVFVCVVFIVASLFSNLMRFLSQRILVDMRTRMMKDLRTDLFRKIDSLNVGYFNTRKKGDILSSISNDVNEVENTVTSSFHVIFRDPLLVIGFLVMLFYMSWKLTIISLIALPLSAIVISKLTKRLRSGAVQTQQIIGNILSAFDETITGGRIIKAFNAGKYVEGNFEKLNESHRRLCRSIFNRQELASPMSEFLGVTVAMLVLFFAGWLKIEGGDEALGMSWQSFIVYIAFYWRVLEPAKLISKAYSMILKGLVSADRIFAILDVDNPVKDPASPKPLDDFKSGIEFRNVTFSYGDRTIINNVSLEIPKGKMIALVGPSGAGKTTLADLIARFYDVQQGSIMLDGNDIRDYRQDDLHKLMGIVTQESILFNDTVYNNIKFGVEDATYEDVLNAAKIANAHEFIERLPMGYETNIGDRGAKLSGGQRQRIAIARAVLKNPPIMILDEATSALDTESERLVQDALTHLMKNRTSVVIAHRLSTIQYADKIVVLQDGEIVEEGTHNELIAKKSVYSHLCELQTFS